MIALETVRTTGLNWQSIGVIVGTIIACLTFMVLVQERRNRAVRQDITEAVTHLGDVLEERLETKTTVAALAARVAVVESETRHHRRW